MVWMKLDWCHKQRIMNGQIHNVLTCVEMKGLLKEKMRYLNKCQRQQKKSPSLAFLSSKTKRESKPFERLITTCRLCKLCPCKYFMRTIKGPINYCSPFFPFFSFCISVISFHSQCFKCLIFQQRLAIYHQGSVYIIIYIVKQQNIMDTIYRIDGIHLRW